MSILKVNTIQKKDGTAFPLGKIGQVISYTYSSGVNISSTSYADITNGGVSITPSSTSSKILVTYHHMYAEIAGGGNDSGANIAIKRDSTYIYNGGANSIDTRNWYIRSDGATSLEMGFQAYITYLDSPATTSAVTYTVWSKTDQGGTTYFNRPKYIILQEVLA